MRLKFRDEWVSVALSLLGVVVSVIALALIGARGLFFAAGAVCTMWLVVELVTFPGWPMNRVGRDVLFAFLGGAVVVFFGLALTWSSLKAASPSTEEPPAVRAAANQVFYELRLDGDILETVDAGEASPVDAYLAVKRESFERERHVLAAHLPFNVYQRIQDFYEFAGYSVSWVMGPQARRHIDQARRAAEGAATRVLPFVH